VHREEKLPTVGLLGRGYLVELVDRAGLALGIPVRRLTPELGHEPDAAPADGCAVVTSCLEADGLGGSAAGTWIAATVARSPYGQVSSYPLAQVTQQLCHRAQVRVPAPGCSDQMKSALQREMIELVCGTGVVGLLTARFDVDPVTGSTVRCGTHLGPHWSGCWTVDGCGTSQYEQQLRAVLDYPMGQTPLLAPAVSTVQVFGPLYGTMSLDERIHHVFAADPGIRIHLYHRPVSTDGMIGQVTALGTDPDEVDIRAARAAQGLGRGVHHGS
jgi:5-(carboxyamino)imidazole ribonucleotide synthase